MMKSLLLVALLQTGVSTPATPVAFAPNSDDWGVGATAAGTLTVSGRDIVIALDDVTLTANADSPDGRRIVGYSVCLAYRKSVEVWSQGTCSSTIEYRTTLKAGESASPGASTLRIPTQGPASLGGYWLVLRVHVARKGGRVGYAFADSQKGLFAPPVPVPDAR